MKVELDIARVRRICEKNLARCVKDSYGLKRIAAMETEIWADYAAKIEDAMKNDSAVGDMEMIERLRPEHR
jgi:hypothetical protein